LILDHIVRTNSEIKELQGIKNLAELGARAQEAYVQGQTNPALQVLREMVMLQGKSVVIPLTLTWEEAAEHGRLALGEMEGVTGEKISNPQAHQWNPAKQAIISRDGGFAKNYWLKGKGTDKFRDMSFGDYPLETANEAAKKEIEKRVPDLKGKLNDKILFRGSNEMHPDLGNLSNTDSTQG